MSEAENPPAFPSMEARRILADELANNPALSNSVAVLRYSTHPDPWHPWERERLREIDAMLSARHPTQEQG